MNPPHAHPLPAWFPVFFLLMWMAICLLLSLIGGWYELSQHYPANKNTHGRKFRMASGSVGRAYLPVSYNSCLMATVCDTGLGLGIFFMFRIFHPPLFIPWSEVESVQEDRLLFIRRCVIRIRGMSQRITLRGGLGQAALQSFSHFSSGRVPVRVD